MGPKSQIRLFRFAGIEVFLHWSWFLVAIFEIQARSGAYTVAGWNVLEYLALFAIVTMHEFGHALACRQVGGTPHHILLWPFGGVAYVNPPQRPGAMLWSIAAGPLVNVALAGPLWLLARSVATAANPNLATFVLAVETINLVLLLFNLLPIYPLDGGQILRSLLWFPLGRGRSLLASAWIGLAGVAAVGLFAMRSVDLWLMAILAYVAYQCWRGLRQAQVLCSMEKLPRRTGFACPSCHAAPPLGTHWSCGQCGAALDSFAGGPCPHCSGAFTGAACADCGRANSLPAWAGAARLANGL